MRLPVAAATFQAKSPTPVKIMRRTIAEITSTGLGRGRRPLHFGHVAAVSANSVPQWVQGVRAILLGRYGLTRSAVRSGQIFSYCR